MQTDCGSFVARKQHLYLKWSVEKAASSFWSSSAVFFCLHFTYLCLSRFFMDYHADWIYYSYLWDIAVKQASKLLLPFHKHFHKIKCEI